MAYGLRVRDGNGALEGVWWAPDEHTRPDAVFLDDWPQHIADGRLYAAQVARDEGTLALVIRADDTVEAQDWLDFLVYLARPGLHAQQELVDGPFLTDAGSAEELLAEVKTWGEEAPPELRYVERTYTP